MIPIIHPPFTLKDLACEQVGMGQEIELEAPASGKPRWQAVFERLHAAALAALGTGVRYELRTYGGAPAKSACWYTLPLFDDESRWVNEPAMGEGFHRIGRYTTGEP